MLVPSREQHVLEDFSVSGNAFCPCLANAFCPCLANAFCPCLAGLVGIVAATGFGSESLMWSSLFLCLARRDEVACRSWLSAQQPTSMAADINDSRHQ